MVKRTTTDAPGKGGLQAYGRAEAPARHARRVRRGTFAQLAQRARQLCAQTSGLSLVEVLVAAAIVAIISVMLVFAFYTMANIGRRASDITSADEELSEDIALDETARKKAVSGELEFTINGKPFKLPSMFNTYTTEDGRSFSTFEYGG